jgi:hypothetical protein
VLKPDSSNLYDVRKRCKVRGFQMSEHGVRVVAQEFSNGTGKVAPAKITPLNGVEMSAEDREVLGIDIDEADAPSPHSVVAAQSRIRSCASRSFAPNSTAPRRERKRSGASWSSARRFTRRSSRPGTDREHLAEPLPAEIAAIFADPTRRPRCG